MKSYSTLRTLYGKYTKNTSSANLTQGDEWINDEIRRVCALGDFPFMHKDRNLNSVANQQDYALPYDMDTVTTVKMTIGTVRYSPAPVNNQREWDVLNFGQYRSDVPEKFFVKDGQVSLWPTPVTSGNVMTLNGRLKVRDLNTVDITGTTITTLAAGGTALTVSGGLTVQMVGFWIRPTFSTTANTGDGEWYELSAIGSSTTATLIRQYGGLAIAAGTAASIISQVPILPEAFHDLPAVAAAEEYWATNDDPKRLVYFQNRHKELMQDFNSSYKTNINNPVVDDGLGNEYMGMNPNLYPTGLHG